MIQDIFLPEKLGNYFLFSQRIVGIDITKTHIYATLLTAKGSTVSIKKQVSESFNVESSPNNEQQNHTDRTIAAITQIMSTIGKVDKIRVSLPSSVVVFKELRMPFTAYDKINLVIRFEVEPLLPFSAKDAVIDFIITHVNQEEQSAQVLVAAVQKQHVAQRLSLFEQAGVDPTVITVDMFALYGLYTQIPDYQSMTDSVMLLDLDMHTTRIVAIHNQQLRIIRTLSYGIATVAKNAGTSTGITPKEALDHLIRFGIEQGNNPEQNQAIQKSLTEFFNKIQFALTTINAQLQSNTITKILLLGAGAQVKDISSFAHTILQVPCELFDIKTLTNNKIYRIQKSLSISTPELMSVAIAVPAPITEHFNLRKGEFEPLQSTLLLKQFIIAGVLIVVLFGSLIAHNIIQANRLRNEINTSQEEAIEQLSERFPEISEDEDELDEVVTTAKSSLEKEEKIWLAFSSQARASFLEYLLELSTRINKQQLGFVPEQLTIADGTIGEITLKAKVRDFDALKQLEKVLDESKLFSSLAGQDDPDFTMKITIKRNR